MNTIQQIKQKLENKDISKLLKQIPSQSHKNTTKELNKLLSTRNTKRVSKRF